MPDQLNLGSLGLGQMQQPLNTPDLKQVNFSDIPSYAGAPSFSDGKAEGDFLSSILHKPIDKSKLTTIQPRTFNNKELRKLSNSTVYNELGYNPGSNEEDRYDQAQPWWEATKNSAVKLGAKSWDSFTSFFQQNIDTFNSLTNLELDRSWKNDENLRRISSDALIDEAYPNFQSTTRPRWYSFIPGTTGSGEFYEQFVPQLGFTIGTMAGALVENALIDVMTAGTAAPVVAGSSLRKVFGAISGFTNLRRATQAVEAITAGKNLAINGLKIGANGWAFYNTAASESAMEGGMTYNEVKKQLVDEYHEKNGFMPGTNEMKAIDKAATSAGNLTFGINMPILLASNAAQFGNLLFPALAKAKYIRDAEKGIEYALEGSGLAKKWVANDVVAEGFRTAWKGGDILTRAKLLGSALSNGKFAFMTEGIEESLQRGASSTASKLSIDDYYGKRNVGKAVKHGVSDIFTADGWQEFVGGALGGLLFEGVNHAMSAKSRMQQEQSKRDHVNEVLKTVNNETLESVLKDEGFKTAFEVFRDSAKLDKFSQKGDMYNVANTKNNTFNRWMYNALSTGKVDLRMRELADAKNLSEEEIGQLIGQDASGYHSMIDKMMEDAKHFESIFEKEKTRFDKPYVSSLINYKIKKNALDKYSKSLKERHKNDSIEDIFTPLDVYNTRGDEDTSGFSADILHLEADKALYDKLHGDAQEALLHHAGVAEGRKAAVFASSDMYDSAKRAKRLISDIKKDTDFDFYLIENLLDVNSVEDHLKAQKDYAKMLTAEHKQSANDRVELLEDILQSYQTETSADKIANKIYKYVLATSAENRKGGNVRWNSKAKKDEHIAAITDIVKLQARQQGNLDLYNAMTSITDVNEFAKHYSDVVKDFMMRAFDYHSKLEGFDVKAQAAETVGSNQPEQPAQNSQPVNNPAPQEAQPTQATPTQTDPVVTPTPTAPSNQDTFDTIKAKLLNGGSISEEEKNKLAALAGFMPEAMTLWNNFFEDKAPFKKGDLVLHGDNEEVIEDVKKSLIDSGKWIVSFASNPSLFVDAATVEAYDKTPLDIPPVPTDFIPEKEESNPEDDAFNDSSAFAHVDSKMFPNENGHRTIANEVDKKTFNEETPTLVDDYSAFKQGFLNRMADTGDLDRFVGYMVLDKKENYPVGSPSYNWLSNPANKPGTVLSVRDTKGNSLFNDNYVADPNGQALTFALVNSTAKVELRDVMIREGISEVRVDLADISHGMFDRRVDKAGKPVFASTASLVANIPTTEYQLQIAVSPTGEQYMTVNGTKLRVGGLYLKTKGSFIKLYPVTVGQVKMPGVENFELQPLLDATYRTVDEAQAVKRFLETILYTNREKAGTIFNVFPKKGTFKVEANRMRPATQEEATHGYSMMVVPYSKEELRGILKDSKINVVGSLIGSAFDVFTVEKGDLKKHRVDYNEFILGNTVEDKKAYSFKGQKVLRPVNRYLTLKETLMSIKTRVEEEAAEKRKVEQPTQAPQPTRTRRTPRQAPPTQDEEDLRDLFSMITPGDHMPFTQEEIKFVQDRFGKNAIQVLTIANSNAWGVWTESGIMLYNNAAEGTAYHEAWHEFSQMYLTHDQKNDLYNEARASLGKLTNREAEEAIAEDFKEYMKTGESKILKGRPKRNTIFRMIADFIKRLFKSRQTIDRAYRELHKGMLFGYKRNAKNMGFKVLYSRITDENNNQLFDNTKGARYLRYMDSVMGRAMANFKIHPSYVHSANKDKALNYLYVLYTGRSRDVNDKSVRTGMRQIIDQDAQYLDQQIAEMEDKGEDVSFLIETLNDMDTMLNNFKSMVTAHRKFSSLNIAEEDEDDAAAFELDLDRLDADNVQDAGSVDDTEKTEAEFGGKQWDNAGNEMSLLQSSSEDTKTLIRILSKVMLDSNGYPRRDVNGKVMLFRNDFGLTEPVNFTQLFNNLGTLLEGSFGIQEMYDRLSDLNNQRKYPEIALLLERLPNINETSRFDDIQLLTRFAKDFGKIYVPIYSLVKIADNDTGYYIFKEETKRTKDLVERSWADNFLSKSPADKDVLSSRVLFDENRRPYINREASLDYNFDRQSDVDDFLHLIGISFSRLTKESREYKNIVTKENLSFLRNSLRYRLDANQSITNPIRDLDSEFSTTRADGRGRIMVKSESRIINMLSDLEAKYTTESPSMSFRNAEGNMQHGLSQPMWILQNKKWLNDIQDYKVLSRIPEAAHLNVMNNPNVRNSLYLNKLFNLIPGTLDYGERLRDENKELIQLEIGNYNGVKQTNEDGTSTGAGTTSLSGREKIVMDIVSLLTTGAVEIMRTESSASAFFVRLSNYKHANKRQRHLPIPTEALKGNVDDALVHTIFEGYFEDELATIVNLYNSPLPGYHPTKKELSDHYEKGKAISNPGRFSMFRDIIPVDMQLAIFDQINASDAKTVEAKFELVHTLLDKYKEDMKGHLVKFFEAEIKSFTAEVRKRGITLQDLTKRVSKDETGNDVSEKVLYTSFIVNDFILNVEYSKLFSGDVAFFKAYHKRSKADISTGTKPVVDNVIVDYLRSTHTRTMAHSLNVGFKDNISLTDTIVMKDDVRASKYINNYAQTLMKLNPGMTEQQAKETLGHRKPHGKQSDAAYYEMTVADGQGHATLDFYRQFRIQIGNWLETDEIMYQKEVIWFRRTNNLYESMSDGQALKQRDDVFMEDNADVVSWFPSVKMQYNGPIKVAGVFAPVNDKFSIAPLLPSVIHGTKWEGFNKELIRKGVGYTKFESGTKKYKYPAVDIYAADWNMELEPHHIATHYTSYLKEQVATKTKPKDKSTWGTQMRKLFLANMFSSGFSTDKFVYILQSYKDILSRIESSNRRSLFNKFGISDEGDEYKIKNVETFFRSLKGEVERRKLNENIRDSIQLDPVTGNFVYPLEINLNKAIVQDLISGMIFKTLTQLKINGDMLIQIASSGYESNDFDYTNADEEHIKQYGTNGLRFYTMQFDKDGNPTTTKAMQVKIALTKEWKKLLKKRHPDGQAIGTIERLNELLKNDEWMEANRKSVTMIGYRIPTQGPNSMEFMEVAEFLPESAGSIVILPAEIVAKSGSDYDIDKMNIFRPSFTDSGDLITDESAEQTENEIIEIQNKLRELQKGRTYAEGEAIDHILREDLLEEEINDELDIHDFTDEMIALIERYKEIRGSGRKALYANQIMELYRTVLESPEMFTQLITPNNTDLVRPVAKELEGHLGLRLEDYQDTDVLRYLSNLYKFEQLLSGKRDLGVFALANVASQLFQQSGLSLNQSYNVFRENKYKGKTKLVRKINLKLLHADEKAQLLKDGKIDFSNKYNVEGVLKQEYFSQMINSTVDIASDPYYMGFGFNKETLGVAVYLMHLGVPFKRIVYFLQQPVIKHYTDTLVKNPDPKMKASIRLAVLNRITVEQALNTRGAGGIVASAIENVDNHNANEYFSDKRLQQTIEFAGSKYGDYYLASANDDFFHQKRIFAHFLKLQEQAQALRELQGTLNFDTSKFVTPISVESNILLREKVADSGLFDEEAVDVMRNNSMISAFNNLTVQSKIYKTIMPVGMHPLIVRLSALLLQEYFANKISRLKLERVLNNDWIEYIIKNFAEVNGINFEILGRDLIKEHPSGQVRTLAQELGVIKHKYPELEYFELFRRLFANFSKIQPDVKNIELYRGLDNSSESQNIFIEHYQTLKNFRGTEIPGKTFTQSEVEEIRAFFIKLQYLAFFQSGFNKSPISFLDIVPHEELSTRFTAALQQFQQFVGNDETIFYNVAMDFIGKFRTQNKSFGLFEEDAVVNKEPYRGKHYLNNDMDKFQGITTNPYAFDPDEIVTEDDIDTTIGLPAPQKQLPSSGLPRLQMQPDNVIKIKAGTKTVTNRKEYFTDGEYELPDGTRVMIQMIGKARINQNTNTLFSEEVTILTPKGSVLTSSFTKESLAIAEGFTDWTDFVRNNKYSTNFVNGKEERYLYSVKVTGKLTRSTGADLNKAKLIADDVLQVISAGIFGKSFKDSYLAGEYEDALRMISDQLLDPPTYWSTINMILSGREDIAQSILGYFQDDNTQDKIDGCLGQ